jgi:hypothetical protein
MIDIDKILSEWSYRCSKGYPDLNDPNDLNILKEVMAEMNVTFPINEIAEQQELNDWDVALNDGLEFLQEDDFYDITNALNERIVIKEEADITVDDLLSLIKSKQLPQNLLNKIESLITASDSEASVYNFLVDTVKLSPKTAKYIISQAINYRCYRKLNEMASDPDKRLPLADLGTEGNLLEKVESLGLPVDFIKDIWTIKEPKSGVASGAGEVCYQLILQDGYSLRKGDLGVGSIEFEVKTATKSGTKETGFRLRGQNGYGIGNKSGIYVFKKIADLAYEAGIKLPPEASGERAQLYLKASDSLADTFFVQLVEKGITLNQIATIYADSLLQVYTQGNKEQLIGIVEDSLAPDGKLTMDVFLPKLAAFEFQYYSSIENWEKFLTTNGNFNYMILESGMSFGTLENLMKSRFYVTPPNTKSNATPQDSLCSLRLK